MIKSLANLTRETRDLKLSPKVLLAYIYTYLIIFNPIFAFAPTIQQITMYCVGMLIIITKMNIVRRIVRKIKKELIFSILIVFFCFCKIIFGGDSVLLLPSIKIFILDWILVLSTAAIWVSINPKVNLYRVLTKVGIIAVYISIILLAIPPLNNITKSILFMDDYTRETLELLGHARAFGLAEGLTFSYSVILSYLCILLSQIKYGKNKELIYIFLFCIAMAVNARVGLLIYMVYYIVRILINREFSLLFKIIGGILFGFSLILYSGIYESHKDTIDWILEMVYMISDVLFGTSLGPKFGHMDGLLGTFLIFPSTIGDWIFGSGKVLLGGPTDIGFISQLNFGGIIFVASIYVYVFNICKKIGTYSHDKILKLSLFFAFILANWKGDVVYQGSVMRLLMLIYICSICMRIFNYNKRRKYVSIYDSHGRLQ